MYVGGGGIVTSLCTHDYPKHFVCVGLSCVWTPKPLLLSAYDDVEAPYFTRTAKALLYFNSWQAARLYVTYSITYQPFCSLSTYFNFGQCCHLMISLRKFDF